jgi:hypothetical protein
MREEIVMSKTVPFPKREKAPYSPPRLTVYGHASLLTAAGSSGVAEGGSGSTNKLKP